MFGRQKEEPVNVVEFTMEDLAPLAPPETGVVADLTGEAPAIEEKLPEPPATPDVQPPWDNLGEALLRDRQQEGEVAFVCDRWAGVSLHGKGIKFAKGRFVTSDPVKIAVLDAWEHSRRDA